MLSRRRNLQLQALLISLILYALLFLFLFFRLNISLFGIKIPEIQQGDQPQQQKPTPTRVIWQPQQSGQSTSSTQQPTLQHQQQQSSQPSQTQQAVTHDTSQQETSTSPTQQPHTDQRTERSAEQAESQTEAQPTPQRPRAISHHASRVAGEHEQQSPSHEHREETSTEQQQSTMIEEQQRRANKHKWFKQNVHPTRTASHSTSHHTRSSHKGKHLYDAVCRYARETQAASAQPAASGDVYGTSHAHENATAVAYETFAGKSDMAIVRASHQMQYQVYTAEYVRSTMRITYTSNRRGELEHLAVVTTSGNEAIDKTICNIIRSADLPPLPPEHKENAITRTITIMIHKAPGSDPVILYISQK